MAYVLVANITMDYLESLITRCGFSDVTATADPNHENGLVSVQNLDGNIIAFSDLGGLRDWLVTSYLIQQNS